LPVNNNGSYDERDRDGELDHHQPLSQEYPLCTCGKTSFNTVTGLKDDSTRAG
jgi:hypothetical protein